MNAILRRPAIAGIVAVVVIFSSRVASAQAAAPAASSTPSASSPANASPAPASPATAPTDAARSEGEHHYQHGLDLYRAGELERALHEFQAAYDLVHIPALLYNVGVAQRQLGDLDSAIRTFEQYIATGGDQIPADRRNEMLELLAQMRRDTVEVRFAASLPEGVRARLSMDGHALGEGPWNRTYRFSEGEHEARLQADGIPDVVERVRITRGTAAVVALRMERPRTTGLLHVSLAAGVRGATGRIDDRAGVSLPLEIEIEGGPHVVRVSAPGYIAAERHVVVTARDRTNVELVLLPIVVPPIYTRGWFIGSAGAVVVGAVATVIAIVATTPRPRGDTTMGTLCWEMSTSETAAGCTP